MTGLIVVAGVVGVLVLGALTLALVGAAGKRSRAEAMTTGRRLVEPKPNPRTFTPPPAAEWTPERIVQGGGLRRAQP